MLSLTSGLGLHVTASSLSAECNKKARSSLHSVPAEQGTASAAALWFSKAAVLKDVCAPLSQGLVLAKH